MLEQIVAKDVVRDAYKAAALNVPHAEAVAIAAQQTGQAVETVQAVIDEAAE